MNIENWKHGNLTIAINIPSNIFHRMILFALVDFWPHLERIPQQTDLHNPAFVLLAIWLNILRRYTTFLSMCICEYVCAFVCVCMCVCAYVIICVFVCCRLTKIMRKKSPKSQSIPIEKHRSIYIFTLNFIFKVKLLAFYLIF